MNGVKEVIGRVLVDFGDDAGAGALPVIAFEIAAQVELLAHREFLGQTEDAAIALTSRVSAFCVRVTPADVSHDASTGMRNRTRSLCRVHRQCRHSAIREKPMFRLTRQDEAGGLEKPLICSFQVISHWDKAA